MRRMSVGMIRDELIPALIVAVLLGIYGFLLVNHNAVPDDLKTLVVAVVSFYFGGKAPAITAQAIRTTAAAIANGNGVHVEPPTDTHAA